MSDVTVLETGSQAVSAAAGAWAEAAHRAVKERGVFRVVLSGGATAKALFFILSKPEYADLPWKETEFFWGDDRYVAISHGDSNHRAARDLLLQPVGAVADRIHPMPTGGTDPKGDAERYETMLRKHFGGDLDADGFPIFDLAVQGMGKDGHTASLFPNKAAVSEKKSWVVAARGPATMSVRDRLTMTVPLLQRARTIMFLVTGDEKADKVAQWLEGDDAPESLPAKMIVPLNGKRLIFLDQEAASKLKSG